MTKKRAIAQIEKFGLCLTFPIDNAKTPPSLWYAFYPRTAMRWEWDDSGDNRVAELWHLREELSRSGRVVYAKWYRGRATFFSRFVAAALLRLLNPDLDSAAIQTEDALNLLTLLEESSPQSTKELKVAAGLQGKFHQKTYDKSLKELWDRLLIVGYGERDDGAFPSLCMGATKHLFESVWNDAQALTPDAAWARLQRYFPENPAFEIYLKKLIPKVRGAALLPNRTNAVPKRKPSKRLST